MKKKREMTITEFARMGGVARAKKLSPERRREIGRMGQAARRKNARTKTRPAA